MDDPGRFKGPFLIFLIVLLALGLRLSFLENTGLEVDPDPYNIVRVAEAMGQGEFMLKGFWGAVIWPTIQPLYPLLVALLTTLTGDLFWSGKLVALAAGVAALPVVYLLWERAESGRVGLLAAWLLAVNWVAWYHSIHAFRDTLFLFFSAISLYFLYRARDEFRWLPLLGLALGLATMTREEGYILAVSAFLALGYWKREYLRVEWSRREVLYALLCLLAFVGVIYPWHYYRSVEIGSLVPPFSEYEVKTWGRAGLSWFPSMAQSVSLPLFALALGGIYLSRRRLERHLPLLLFMALYSAAHMWFPNPAVRYTMPLLPLLLGWASIAILRAVYVIPGRRWAPLLFFLVLATPLAYNLSLVRGIEEKPNRYDVIKEAVEWFDANSEPDASLMAGEDHFVYSRFTRKRVVGYVELARLFNEEAISALRLSEPFYSFLISENIHYVVANDTLHPWMYNWGVQEFFERALNKKVEVLYQQLVFDPPIEAAIYGVDTRIHAKKGVKARVWFTPIRTFERNGELVVLYRFDWEVVG